MNITPDPNDPDGIYFMNYNQDFSYDGISEYLIVCNGQVCFGRHKEGLQDL